jgi:hypothetical protein
MDAAQRKWKKATKSYQLASALLQSTPLECTWKPWRWTRPCQQHEAVAACSGVGRPKREWRGGPHRWRMAASQNGRTTARRLLRQLELQRPPRKKRWRSALARRATATEEGGGDARRCNLMASGGERQPSNEEDGGAARPNRGERLRSAGSASDSAGRSADSFYSPTRATDIATHDNQSGRDTRALSRWQAGPTGISFFWFNKHDSGSWLRKNI